MFHPQIVGFFSVVFFLVLWFIILYNRDLDKDSAISCES